MMKIAIKSNTSTNKRDALCTDISVWPAVINFTTLAITYTLYRYLIFQPKKEIIELSHI